MTHQIEIWIPLVSGLVSMSLVWLGSRLSSIMLRSDLSAVQASHTRETLRFGGLGIAVALVLMVATRGPEAKVLFLMLGASVPVFLSGLLEDIGIYQSPRRRLAAAVLSSLLAIWLLEAHLPHIGISYLDAVFAIFAFAAAFTIVSTVGVIHAFNLIDGLNGLAGITAVAACASFLVIANLAGSPEVGLVASTLLAAMLGFLAVNYPYGRIFLGDAGAYLVGFMLVWIAVKLLHQTGTVAPWSMALVLFWPIADTLLAIIRRRVKRQKVTHPDRMHFHHVVMRGIEIALLGRRDRRISNPLATAILAPFVVMPPITAVLLWNSPTEALLATVGFGLLFATTYVLTVRALKTGRLRRKRVGFGSFPTASKPLTNQTFEH